MIKVKKVLARRDSTLNRIPWYPNDIHGRAVRLSLSRTGMNPEVYDNPAVWYVWVNKLVKAGLIMQTRDGHYSRPRSQSDLDHAYKRKQTFIPLCAAGVEYCRKKGPHGHQGANSHVYYTPSKKAGRRGTIGPPPRPLPWMSNK